MTTLPPAKKRNPKIEDFHFPAGLPTANELPYSDGMPADSELQELMPGLLKAILRDIWRNRRGWLFSIDMGFYYDPTHPRTAISPDGMLSLGLDDAPGDGLRLSYVLWQEKVIPLFVVEIVSPNRKNNKKFEASQSVGVLYYLVYSPWSETRFQLYKLVEGDYVLQSSGEEPYWMPEVGLAIGRETLVYDQTDREWLFWYDENEVRYLTPWEKADAAEARADAAKAGADAAKAGADAAKARADAAKAGADAAKAGADAAKARADTAKAGADAAKARADTAKANDYAAKNKLLADRLRKLGVDPDLL
jgi:Uma2 family endonuclease